MNKNITGVLLLVLAAGCSSQPREGAFAPPLDPTRRVSEQDCSRPIDTDGGNLMCREVTEAERRARAAEEERQARARKEAEERAARERLERERAEQLAREEAARKLREAEEESGLRDLSLVPGIFDLDRHRIPAWRDVPEHWHYDVRYVVRAGGSEAFTVSDESHALAWRDIRALADDPTADASVRRMAGKWIVR